MGKTMLNTLTLILLQNKLYGGHYTKPSQFADDVRLMFANCYKYNPKGDLVVQSGTRLQAIFETMWSQKPELLESPPHYQQIQHEQQRSSSPPRMTPSSTSSSAAAGGGGSSGGMMPSTSSGVTSNNNKSMNKHHHHHRAALDSSSASSSDSDDDEVDDLQGTVGF